MRLLLVSHARNNPDAGASRVYHLLTEGLRARGHFVECLHYEDISFPPYLEGIANRLALPQYASKLAAPLVEQFDAVLSSSGMLYPLFKKLKQSRSRPLLINHVHGLAYFDRQAIYSEVDRGHLTVSWKYRALTGRLPVYWDAQGAKYADLSIVQNGRDADFLEEYNSSPIATVPLPVHPRILLAGENARMQTARDPMKLLWFGSWVERKGMYYLPRAFDAILEKFPAATLTIGGTGWSAERILQDFSTSARSRITVLPRVSVDEHIELLQSNAIFLFPSLSEGFGFAVLEAMSMGMAVVTTQTGLGGDLLRDNVNARIIPASSALHLANATIDLISDAESRNRIGVNAQRFAKDFSVDRFTQTYEELISAQISKSRK